MLAKENRLRSKKDIEAVFRSGRGYKEGFLLLKTSKNNLEVARVGFAVSQKAAKKAVLRNAIKRKLRALIRDRIIKIRNGVDLMFVVLPGIERKDFSGLAGSTDKLLIRGKCLKITEDQKR